MGRGRGFPNVCPARRGRIPGRAWPGRLLDHIGQGHAHLDGIEILVLDEADRMLDMGFLPDVKRILQHIPAKRQSMLFSATFPQEIENWPTRRSITPNALPSASAGRAYTVQHALTRCPQPEDLPVAGPAPSRLTPSRS